jgi:hypothetical protein
MPGEAALPPPVDLAAGRELEICGAEAAIPSWFMKEDFGLILQIESYTLVLK